MGLSPVKQELEKGNIKKLRNRFQSMENYKLKIGGDQRFNRHNNSSNDYKRSNS